MVNDMDDLAVQMASLDGKLEKHIGITETILENQKEILTEIREEMRMQNARFATHDDVESIKNAVLIETKESVDAELAGFEKRLNNKIAFSWGVVATAGIVIYSLAQLYVEAMF